MDNNPSRATYGHGLPSVDTSLRSTMYEPVPQDIWTSSNGDSGMTQAPNSRSPVSINQSERKTRIKNPCDPCKSRKIKCDEDKPCKSCITHNRDCTISSTGQAVRTGPHPGGGPEKDPPVFKSLPSWSLEELRKLNGATLHVPDDFAKWAVEFGERSWPPPDQQTVPSYEQSNAAPPTQQVPPDLHFWPPRPTHGAGAAGGTWPSVGHEDQTLLPPMRPMFGEDDYFAIPYGRGPSRNTDTLPSIGSLYWHPPMERTGNDDDVQRR